MTGRASQGSSPESRALTWTRLSARALAQQRWVCLLVVVIVALLSGLLAAWPRLDQAAKADQVRYRIADSSAIGRDVAATVSAQSVLYGTTAGGPGLSEAEIWEAFDAEIAALREARDAPLRSVLGQADRVAVTIKEFEPAVNPDVDVRSPSLALAGDPDLADRVTLSQGRWPQAPQWDAGSTPTTGAPGEARPDFQVEILVLEETAQRLGLTLGEPVRVPTTYVDMSLVLVGTYTVDDLTDPYWGHISAAAAPSVVEDLNAGTAVAGIGYTAADGWWRTLQATQESAEVRVWFDVDPDALDGVDPALLASQLRSFVGTDHTLAGAQGVRARFGSDLPERMDAVASENAAVSSVILLVAVGPLGVALAVLALLARLLMERRRTALGIIAARGASARQLRTALTLEGLVLGVPAAALGWATSVVVLDGDPGPRGWVPSLVLGVVPALVLATASLPSGVRRVRRDLRAGGVARDVVIVLLAALTLAQVLASPVGAIAETGDPLLTAAPLVLALAVAVVVLRLYPWLARAAHRALRGSRSLPHFLGSARAVREPSASLTSVLAVVVGVSVAVFAVAALGTLRAGLERTVWVTTGADLRVSGPAVDSEQVEEVLALDGVAAAAAVTSVSPAILQLPAQSPRVQLYLVDPEAYAQVLQEVPASVGAAPVADLRENDGAAIPVLTSPRLDGQGSDGVRLVTSQNVEVEVLPSGDVLPGIADASATWVLADALDLPEVAAANSARLLLVRLTPGADPAEVAASILDIVGPAAVADASGARAAVADTPVFTLLVGALLVAIAAAALLAAGSLVLVQVTAAPRRAALLARLRILGLRRNGERALAWWDLLPWVVLSLAAGLGLGLLTARVLLRPLDLRSFTQGAGQPPLVIDPVALTAVVGVALALTVALSLLTIHPRASASVAEED